MSAPELTELALQIDDDESVRIVIDGNVRARALIKALEDAGFIGRFELDSQKRLTLRIAERVIQ